MGTTTFRSFYDVVRELEEVYGHKELWLYSGLDEDCPFETASRHREWRWPKILKRNGRAVAEFTGKGKDWDFMGDYKTPDNDPCSPPWGACRLDDEFIALCTFFNY